MDYSGWLDRKQAADFLGVTSKTIERMEESGKLTRGLDRRIAGRKPSVVYDPEELRQLKNPVPVRIVNPKPVPPMPADSLPALAPKVGNMAAAFERLAAVAEAIVPSVRNLSESLQDLIHKIYLSPKEAARLSGLPLAEIRRRLRDGRLPSERVGGRRLILRTDVQGIRL